MEGKEAVQLIAREFLQGLHPEARKHLDLVICPAYNADGTDALDPAIRKYQLNPGGGVGRRENARGLDLNRDLMKAQTANTRWFLDMLRDFDPMVVFDLHTTNGSYHGIKVLPGSARPRSPLNFFHETDRTLATHAFQGIYGLTLKGAWTPDEAPRPMAPRWTTEDLDQALYVPLDQPLGRVAFYLLDPRSPDGLVFWGFFHESLLRSDGAWGEPLRFPIAAVGGAGEVAGPESKPPAKKAE